MPSPVRHAAVALVALFLVALPAVPAAAEDADWEGIVARARGTTVRFNAWAGDAAINDYIAWVGAEVGHRYGITLRHVKLSDTAEAVARILAETAAGRTTGGSVDLVWINGENFHALKDRGLLYGPFAERLPNFSLVDPVAKPTTITDSTLPVEGMEAPWGTAQLVLIYDSARVALPPGSIAELAEWARLHPGRFAYPAPPDFLGTTFLKQVLIETTQDAASLRLPAEDERFRAATAALWPWLDRLHPHLWRRGEAFPQNGPAARQLLADGEVDMVLSFNPTEASSAIAQGLLPASVRTAAFREGSIANSHFVAIPKNASAPEASMVVANFLLSPEAQARKQNPDHWGDFTVLAMDRLTPDDRRLFDALPLGPATLPPDRLGPTFVEPHPSWTLSLERAWQERYRR